jgi:hypothetical protein
MTEELLDSQAILKIPSDKSKLDIDDEFGVDPVTSHMNVKEFYGYLLDKFNNDRSQIKTYLRTLDSSRSVGFMHNTFIEESINSMDDIMRDIYCAKLVELSRSWHENKIVTKARTKDDFMKNRLIYERYANSIVTLKYFEQYGARFWKNVWAKEMRGTVLFINPDPDTTAHDHDIQIISFKLPRGAETYTTMVKNRGFDTHDVKAGQIDILDEEQKDTCCRLCADKEINLHLTSKGDGSLLVINCFTGYALDIMKPVVEIFGNNYTKLWARQSMKLTDEKRLFVPSTQGTVMEQGFMGPYMVTSLLVGSHITTRLELEKLDKSGATYEEV